MSYAIDANVLLYASDEGNTLHFPARRFLEACTANPEPLCLAWPTVMAYLRISTHPRIFARPLTPEKAMGNVESLFGLLHVRVLAEEEGFWDCYRKATSGLHIRGNLVPDAHLLAILVQHGVATLYTNDDDFKRFSHIEIRNPFTRHS